MDGSPFMRVAFGILFIVSFAIVVFQMATIRLSASSRRNGALMGVTLFVLAIMQVSMVWGGLRSLPEWALVVVLVGAGFGMSSGLLMIKGAIDSKPRET